MGPKAGELQVVHEWRRPRLSQPDLALKVPTVDDCFFTRHGRSSRYLFVTFRARLVHYVFCQPKTVYEHQDTLLNLVISLQASAGDSVTYCDCKTVGHDTFSFVVQVFPFQNISGYLMKTNTSPMNLQSPTQLLAP